MGRGVVVPPLAIMPPDVQYPPDGKQPGLDTPHQFARQRRFHDEKLTMIQNIRIQNIEVSINRWYGFNRVHEFLSCILMGRYLHSPICRVNAKGIEMPL